MASKYYFSKKLYFFCLVLYCVFFYPLFVIACFVYFMFLDASFFNVVGMAFAFPILTYSFFYILFFYKYLSEEYFFELNDGKILLPSGEVLLNLADVVEVKKRNDIALLGRVIHFVIKPIHRRRQFKNFPLFISFGYKLAILSFSFVAGGRRVLNDFYDLATSEHSKDII